MIAARIKKKINDHPPQAAEKIPTHNPARTHRTTLALLLVVLYPSRNSQEMSSGSSMMYRSVSASTVRLRIGILIAKKNAAKKQPALPPSFLPMKKVQTRDRAMINRGSRDNAFTSVISLSKKCRNL